MGRLRRRRDGLHGGKRLAAHPDVWEINSIGEVTHDRQRMLIAVLSRDNAAEDSGISLVETGAAKAAHAIARS